MFTRKKYVIILSLLSKAPQCISSVIRLGATQINDVSAGVNSELLNKGALAIFPIGSLARIESSTLESLEFRESAIIIVSSLRQPKSDIKINCPHLPKYILNIGEQ
jgi:hypothetical protein